MEIEDGDIGSKQQNLNNPHVEVVGGSVSVLDHRLLAFLGHRFVS